MFAHVSASLGLGRDKLGRKLGVRAESAFPTITDVDARLAIAGITPTSDSAAAQRVTPRIYANAAPGFRYRRREHSGLTWVMIPERA